MEIGPPSPADLVSTAAAWQRLVSKKMCCSCLLWPAPVLQLVKPCTLCPHSLDCRFTRDAQLLRKVGHVLLQQQHPSGHTQPLKRWLVAKDAFAMVLPGTSQAIYNALAGNKFQVVQSVLGSPTEINVAEGVNELENQGLGGLEQWVKNFRVTQVWTICVSQ
eukprot:GHRR01037363.1.p1 GENE.GHRR01037363.1~~GHRR01037363.1.p1  ORF type:complete len:162 (-),score=29.16 GHRR01037363.1:290-775(-)